MASTSEVTIGAKVTNAEKISTNLKAFAGYAPSDTALTAVELDKLINNTKTKNTEAASAAQDYSSAVDTRQKLFQKNNNYFCHATVSLNYYSINPTLTFMV